MRRASALALLLLAAALPARADYHTSAADRPSAWDVESRQSLLGDELTGNTKGGKRKKVLEGAGCITGMVKWVGNPPILDELKVERDTPICELTKDDQSLIVGDAGGVANTFVFLSELTLVSDPEPQHGIIEQLNCLYRPHAQVISAGSLLVLRNADPLPASFKGRLNQAPMFDVNINPGQAPPAPTKLSAGGMMTVRSERNSWQNAVIFVATTGFSDLTGEDGRYTIREIPPGKYRIAALHEPWGKSSTPRRVVKVVTVVPRICVTLDFELNGNEAAAPAKP